MISLVIPTYNGLHLLKKYLLDNTKILTKNDELIIVDDASSDDTTAWLSKTLNLHAEGNKSGEYGTFELFSKYSDQDFTIKVIKNTHNLRFAASVNRAVQQAQEEYILLLNNDVAIADPQSCRDALLKVMTSSQKVFGVGCKEFQTHQDNQATGKNKLWFERGRFMHSADDSKTTGQTAWASGGSALFDRAKWLELKGFDLHFYPAYWEDIDLSFRAKCKDWQVWFCAEAVVYHHHETTNKQEFGSSGIAKISWKNGTYFTLKHAKGGQLIQFLLWWPYWQWRILKS